MTPSPAHVHPLDNGMTLVAEPMPWLESAALSLWAPAGCCRDPDDREGLSNLVAEMMLRGCGPRDSRRFIEDLERLGVDRFSSVSNAHVHHGGAMPAESLLDAMAVFADLVRRPRLPADQLDEARMLCIHEARAVEDELGQKTMQVLRRRFYPEPYGRSAPGRVEHLEQATADDVRRFYQDHVGPQDAILSVAGKFDWRRLAEQAERLFGDWRPQTGAPPAERPARGGYLHVERDSEQTHIGVAFPAVAYGDPDYFLARAAVGVLSDGMSSRLFREVRERRGLCYTVYAVNHFVRGRGAVLCYAATTTQRAQETLDVLLAELQRLAEGVRPEELQRLKAKIKSALVMQQESSPARSSAVAADWYFLRRVYTIDELKRIVDQITCERVNEYLAQHPPRRFTIVTLGARPLETPCGVSTPDA